MSDGRSFPPGIFFLSKADLPRVSFEPNTWPEYMKATLPLTQFVALALSLSTEYAPGAEPRSVSANNEPFPVTIKVWASRPMGSLRPIWRFFGADEPNYATMKNGQKL